MVAQKYAQAASKQVKVMKGHRSKQKSGHDVVSSDDDSTSSSSIYTLVQGSGSQVRIPPPSAEMIKVARKAQLRKAQLLKELPNRRTNLQARYQENDNERVVPRPPVVGEELAEQEKSFRDCAIQAKAES